nr:hypothetical protein [Tanacetum cinerariifolium]
MVVTPVNNNKKIRFTEHIPSSGNTPIKTTSSINVVSNKPVLSSTGVNLITSASGSKPQGNTKKDRIQRTQSRAKKNKLEDHPRTVRPILHKKKSVVNTKPISSVTNSKLNVKSDLKCATCNGCLFFDNHDSCVLEFINSINARVKSKSAKKPGEGHMSKQCTKPKRKRDEQWFKDKMLLVQAQANGQVLQEEELEFLADPAIAETSKQKVTLLTNDFQNEESQNIDRELALEKQVKENGVIERRNRTLIEAARTMLIYDQAPLFLWAEAVNLGKLQPKADIGIFIGYAPTKKAFRIYNRRTRRIVETIHVDFNELMAMASEQSSSGPTLNEMTPATISSGHMQKPSSSTP